MNYRKTIVEAWNYTQANKRLIYWLGVVPAFFTTTVYIGYIAYQFWAFKKSFLFSEHEGSALKDVALMIWDFIQTHFSWTLPLIIIAIIFTIIYLLLPTLTEAAAVQVIARNKNGQHVSISKGVRHGIMCFLRLFEYHLLIKTFSIFSILIEMSFVLRNLGIGIFEMMLPIFFLVLLVSFILMLLFSYSDYYIVIDGEGVLNSIKKSTRLVIVNWRHTFLITFLMILIGIRIIIQAFIVFLIPIMVVGITGYLTTILVPSTSILLGGILGLISLLIAAYINGVVNIFSYAVWTLTFLELTSEKEISARDKVEDFVSPGDEKKDINFPFSKHPDI